MPAQSPSSGDVVSSRCPPPVTDQAGPLAWDRRSLSRGLDSDRRSTAGDVASYGPYDPKSRLS